MQMGFIISEGRADGVVKPNQAEGVLKDFGDSQRSKVHRDIKKIVQEMGVLKAIVGKDIILEKVVKLIAQRLTPASEDRWRSNIFTMYSYPLN